MADANEMLLDADDQVSTGRSRQDSQRSRFAVFGIAVGVLATVAVIVGVTTNHSNGVHKSNTQSPQNSQQQAYSAAMVPEHPMLKNMPHEAVTIPGDSKHMRYSGSMIATSGSHFTNYSYSVDVPKDVHHLEKVLGISSVTCSGNRLTVHFNDSTLTAAFGNSLNANSTLITVLKEWIGCGATNKVLKVAPNPGVAFDGPSVSVTTTQVDVSALFKNANIVFNGTGFNTTSKSTGSSPRERRGFLWDDDDNTASTSTEAVGSTTSASTSGASDDDFLGDVWGDITGAISSAWNTVVGDVTSAFSSIDNFVADAEKVGAFLEKLYNNKGDYSKSGDVWQKSVQVGPKSIAPSMPELTAQYGYDVNLAFSLQITDYELQSISMTANGDANAGVNAQGQVVSDSFSGTQGPFTIIPQEQFISFTIPAGPIPIPVSISGSMTTKMDWSISGSVSVDGNVKASGQVHAGFNWNAGQGFSPVKTASFTSDAVLNYVTATATTTVTITANTQLLIEAMYSVGLQTQVAVAPVIHATVTETVEGAGISVSDAGSGLTVTKINPSSPPSTSPCNPRRTSGPLDTPSVSASVGAGVTVSAAAVVDIAALHINNKYNICQDNGGTCYQHLWNPIDSWCIHP